MAVDPAVAAGAYIGAGMAQMNAAAQYPSGVQATDPWMGDAVAPNAYVGVPPDYRVFKGVAYEGYLGQTPVPQYKKPIYTQSDIAQAAQLPRDQMLSLQMQLYNIGALDKIDVPGFFTPATHDALEAAMGIANTRGWSINQLSDYMTDNHKTFKDMGLLSGSTGSGGSGADYSPYTTTSTTNSTSVDTNESVNLSGRGSARAIMEQAWQAEVGRDPNGREFQRFLRYLHHKERNNPSTTKTTTDSTSTSTTTTDPSKSGDTTVNTDTSTTNDTSTVSKESNVNPSQTAENYAERHNNREAKAFHSGQYMDVIAGLIGLS